MGNNRLQLLREKLSEWRDKASEWLAGQQWYQQLREKWDELDAQTQRVVRMGAAALGLALGVLLSLSFAWSVHSSKREWREKLELLSTLQSANDEIRRLRDTNQSALARADSGPWAGYLEQLAAQIGLAKESLTVGSEKPLDAADVSADLAKAITFDVSLKQVNIRQLVKLAHAIESGARPLRLKQLTIDTKPDASGYLDAALALVGYQLTTAEPASGGRSR